MTAASSSRWLALVLLAIAELFGMAMWFSASASVPFLRAEWQRGDRAAAWLTLAVQLGFVAGTLLSAMLNLPDIIDTRSLFALSSLGGALVNAAFGLFAHGPAFGIPLRFATGLCLAGV